MGNLALGASVAKLLTEVMVGLTYISLKQQKSQSMPFHSEPDRSIAADFTVYKQLIES